MKTLLLISIFVSSLGFAEVRQLTSVEPNVCNNCHGTRGLNLPTPFLENQNSKYMAAQLAAYKDGTRQDLAMKAMNAVANGMDDSAIAAFATYFSNKSACTLPPEVVNPGRGDIEAGRALATSKNCVNCHLTGNALNAPKLNGQKASYLILQLQYFRNGDRKSIYMNPIASQLSDKDAEDLAAFFNSQQICP